MSEYHCAILAMPSIAYVILQICVILKAERSMQLGLYEEALRDAEKGRALAEARLKVTRKSIPGFVKTFLRKGEALNGVHLYVPSAIYQDRLSCRIAISVIEICPRFLRPSTPLCRLEQIQRGVASLGRGLEDRPLQCRPESCLGCRHSGRAGRHFGRYNELGGSQERALIDNE